MNSGNILDKEFEQMLFPLNLMQYVLLQPKYNIVKGVVKANNYASQVIYFIGVLLIAFITVVHLVTLENSLQMCFSNVIHFVGVLDCVCQIGYCLVLFIHHIVEGNRNVLLILKIHRVYKTLKNGNNFKKIRYENWIYIGIIPLTVIVLVCVTIKVDSYLSLLYTYPFIYYNGNVIYATRVLNLLTHEVKLWKDEMNRFVVKCSQKNHTQLRKYLNEVCLQRERLCSSYLDIMTAFKLCGRLYHVPVSQLYINTNQYLI